MHQVIGKNEDFAKPRDVQICVRKSSEISETSNKTKTRL